MPDYSIEKAKGGQAKCKKCKVKIAKEMLRIGVHSEHPDYGTMTKWEHVECHKFNLGSPEEIDGWGTLTDEEQESCTAVLNNKNKRPPPTPEVAPSESCKKMKVGDLKAKLVERGLETTGKKNDLVERLAEAMTADGPTADELDFAKFEAEFQAKSVAVLKELLRLNGQKLSGAKAELVLRCTDAKAYGSLPKCPDCGGGRMEVTYPTRWGHGGQGKFRCKGYYDDDEFVRCNHTEDQMERPKWVEAGEAVVEDEE